jgi:hypothetical protein
MAPAIRRSLFKAARLGNVKALRLRISEIKDQQGDIVNFDYLFSKAVHHGQLAVARIFVEEYGVDVCECSSEYRLLHNTNGNVELTRFL